jgi:hypothetical protein
MPRRVALPDDLKELCSLCRSGKLFAVQDWIKSGRRHRPPEGNFTTNPLRVSIERGFHSLVEVLLRAGCDPKRKGGRTGVGCARAQPRDNAATDRIWSGREAVEQEEVFWSRHPGIIRWFIDHGMDLETGEPIAKAFRDRQQRVSGYLHVPSGQVALGKDPGSDGAKAPRRRRKSQVGSLLLWAGADARLPVPRMDQRERDQEDERSALEESIRYGQTEAARKIGVDPQRDDPTVLLDQYFIQPKSDLMEYLISKGADARQIRQDTIQALFSSFSWSLETGLTENPVRTEEALRCMEVLGKNGARWIPSETWMLTGLRRPLGRISRYVQWSIWIG